MNIKSIFMVVAIAAIMTSGLATMTSIVVPSVYADKDTSKNDFGQRSSEDLAKDGEMGDHSKAGGAAGDPPFDSNDDTKGRSGIGNVFNSGDPKDDPTVSKHPSDTANTLCDLFPSNSACN